MRLRFVVLVAVAALMTTASARADDVYTTSTCRGPGGKPAPTAGWVPSGDAPMTKRDSCSTGGALTIGPSTADSPRSSAIWSFTAPAATRIAGYSIYRTVRTATGSGWSWNWSLFREAADGLQEHYVETCWG